MNTFNIIFLHSTLYLLASSAPLPEYSGELGLFMEDPEFHRAMERSKSLVNKLLSEIPAVHKSCVSSEALTLDPSGDQKNLQYMVTSLGIPPAPVLRALSADFTMEMCLNRMSEGLHLYQNLLSVVHDRISTPEKVTELLADIRDLLAQVQKMRELGQLESGVQYGGSGLGARLTGDYEVQVATHVTLTHLRAFAQDLFRSLRNVARSKPGLRG
ncbi:granulocyte colony-stimulating factor-like [Megalops cyprinoides]|uniref:granulocyte colony-stimulating factor-like n=1 Tax=Megalops cyprinoides TaxID=118141 RepID=UPI001864DB39|nr:granulocyte colony-stimulating factor-like [Megalops cyprinoides]